MRVAVAAAAGRAAAALSRGLRVGGGSVIAGRVALRLDPDVLARLARDRTSVVVTGTNGKTSTSHLIVAALSGRGPVAHNATGSNMLDGAVTALIDTPRARLAVLEVDELHVAPVLDATGPDVLVLLNLSRDQLDRVGEVRATARAVSTLLAHHPDTVVVANADDPMAVWAAGTAARRVWVATGTRWQGDTLACPACGHQLRRHPPQHHVAGRWWCTGCGLRRPSSAWWCSDNSGVQVVHSPGVGPVPLALALPGRVNQGNATVALAAAAAIGTDPASAAPQLARVREIAGRYAHLSHRGRRVRILLVKNPAGWGEALDMLTPARPVLMVVNARGADGHDVSWLWDIPIDILRDRAVAVAGDRAADLGVRLSYAGIGHHTATDPLAALDRLPLGEVDAVANYTAFRDLQRHRAPDGEAGAVGSER